MKKFIKKISIIFILLVIVTLNLPILNKTHAFNLNNIQEKELYCISNCENLLKFNGVIIGSTYIVYNCDGTEFPAYCIDPGLPGIKEYGNYSVINSGNISEVALWRVIVNGYPYKSLEELGVQTKEEAFLATKQAIYCYLANRGTEKYSPIGEAGERTLNALNMILSNAYSSSETKISNIVQINSENENWIKDDINEKYVSKVYNVKVEAEINKYSISLDGTVPEGTKIMDMENNEKNEFSQDEKFKIMIPIEALRNKGNFKIKVFTEMKTKPVIYGKTTVEGTQDYALTTYMFEDSFGEIEENYFENETTITIIKKEKDSESLLENAEFSILDENEKEIYTGLVTNENGEVSVTGILPGSYYIKETKAPSGYAPYDDIIEIKVELNEKAKVIVNNSKEEVIEPEVSEKEIEVEAVTKVVKKLPKTGM